MNIPNLPTDNIYKFKAIFGLILFVVCFMYPRYIIYKLDDETVKVSNALSIIELETKYLGLDLNKIDKDLVAESKLLNRYKIDKNVKIDTTINIVEHKKALMDPKHREYLKFLYDYDKFIFPEHRLSDKIDEQLERLDSLSRYTNMKNLEIGNSLKLIDTKKSQISEIVWFSSIFGTVSIYLMFTGFKDWMKFQKLLDKKMLSRIETSKRPLFKKLRTKS